MSVPVLTCHNLYKSYKGGKMVLDGFQCSLASGKIIGLLGPNGCGKSTLMKLVCGLLVPDHGEIRICGELQSEATNSMISYLPERTYCNSWMRVDELIDYFKDFYPDFDEEAARRMFSELKIDTAQGVDVATSRGIDLADVSQFEHLITPFCHEAIE
jgi:ABC-2 type transport system ATP-binding protein